MKRWVLFLSFLLVQHFCLGQVKWMSIEEAYAKSQQQPKKIIIDVYTNWCGWCKVMDKNTFNNPIVADYINRNYYAVKLDAETQKTIKLGNKVFKYNLSNKANDIAVTLLGGRMSYPSIVYLDEKFGMIQPVPGYMDAKAFHEIITFIGGDFHKSQSFDNYKSKTYKSKYGNLKL